MVARYAKVDTAPRDGALHTRTFRHCISRNARNISEPLEFFNISSETIFFDSIIDICDEPARPGPAMAFFDRLDT